LYHTQQKLAVVYGSHATICTQNHQFPHLNDKPNKTYTQSQRAQSRFLFLESHSLDTNTKNSTVKNWSIHS